MEDLSVLKCLIHEIVDPIIMLFGSFEVFALDPDNLYIILWLSY